MLSAMSLSMHVVLWHICIFLSGHNAYFKYTSLISFQEYVSKGISHPVFYSDLVYKLRRVQDTPNSISSGSKIVKRLRRRQYDQLIIEWTIGLVIGPYTALNRHFLKHCTLTLDPHLLWLLFGTPSTFRPELESRRAEHSLHVFGCHFNIFDR